MAPRLNLIAGIANSICTALAGLVMVPLYLRLLGIETYGLIGLFATAQALLSLLDFGLASTVTREMARKSASGNMREARNLLHTTSIVYVATAILIFILIFGFSSVAANHWFQSSQISASTMERAIVLMGVVVLCRWPSMLYQGVLIGIEQQVLSSCIAMLATTVGAIGSALILVYISQTIEALYVWQASIALVHSLTLHHVAWRVIGRDGNEKFNIDDLRSNWRFSLGISAVAASAVLLTQMDKIVLSRLLTLEQFGQYALAATLVGGLYYLINPIFGIIYPRFSAIVTIGDVEKLARIYRMWTNMFAIAIFAIATFLSVFAKEILVLWTGNYIIASSVGPVVVLLTIGTALHGVMYFPYALQLSYGLTRLPLIINLILTVVLVPLIVILSQSFGAMGGAFAWLIFHMLYMLLGTWITHRYILKDVGMTWLIQDVGTPLMLAISGGLIISNLGTEDYRGAVTKYIYGAGMIFVVICTSVALSQDLRSLLLSRGAIRR